MEKEHPKFYAYEQLEALQAFLPILYPYLPHSNPIYNRLQAPHNTPSRHCLFAATFAPPIHGSEIVVPEVFTVIFADRSRHEETQVWLFNPIICGSPLSVSQSQQDVLSDHLLFAIRFLKETKIPDAPGWPFSPVIRFALVHETMAKSMERLARDRDALSLMNFWNEWIVSTKAFSSGTRKRRRLPDGFKVGRVPQEQLDIVISTSTIKRQPATYLLLPNVAVSNEAGDLVAWSYIGIDGSLGTLYVLPEYRGLGLAAYSAEEVLRKLAEGEFEDIGFCGKSGWAQADVRAGNEGSERVMKAIGGKVGWTCSYMWVDSDKF